MWLQEKLRRCDIRSIDPIVDVTNYILLELGQPMHAFDMAKSGQPVQSSVWRRKMKSLYC